MKKSFVFYLDWMDTLQKLSDEEAGKLIKYIVALQNGEDVQIDRLVEIAATNILTTINRDTNKYNLIVEKRKEAAKKRYQKLTPKPQEKPEPQPKKESIDYTAFLNHFNSITNKNHKVISNKVKGQINARIKEGFTKQDLIKAVINCSKDKYHLETNFKYLTPEFITRTDILDKFLNMQASNKSQSKKESVNQW